MQIIVAERWPVSIAGMRPGKEGAHLDPATSQVARFRKERRIHPAGHLITLACCRVNAAFLSQCPDALPAGRRRSQEPRKASNFVLYCRITMDRAARGLVPDWLPRNPNWLPKPATRWTPQITLFADANCGHESRLNPKGRRPKIETRPGTGC
jgi:hypothetical protein